MLVCTNKGLLSYYTHIEVCTSLSSWAEVCKQGMQDFYTNPDATHFILHKWQLRINMNNPNVSHYKHGCCFSLSHSFSCSLSLSETQSCTSKSSCGLLEIWPENIQPLICLIHTLSNKWLILFLTRAFLTLWPESRVFVSSNHFTFALVVIMACVGRYL